MRHGMDYLSEVYLGYTPMPITKLIGEAKAGQINMADVPVAKVAEYSAEDADVTWQLRAALEPLLKEKGQERVFYEVESPLIPVLVDMEFEGIKVDAAALAEFAAQLSKEMDEAEKTIYRLAGTTFNLNSPRQLGQILFDVLKIGDAPKKTKTGQYATDEQTLAALAADHEIVQRLLEYRTASKLKSTYADALPAGDLAQDGPRPHHLQPGDDHHRAAQFAEPEPAEHPHPHRARPGNPQGLRAARRASTGCCRRITRRSSCASSPRSAMSRPCWRRSRPAWTFTRRPRPGSLASRRTCVTPEMRRKAKMVNFGIAYGISAFGLSQRLGIPREEAATSLTSISSSSPASAVTWTRPSPSRGQHGYVETVTGRRRYLRDIRSANNTVRGAAERNAINAPIQGTAADMIKLAMIAIHRELARRKLKTRMLLQVHDELVFDLYAPEEKEVRAVGRGEDEDRHPAGRAAGGGDGRRRELAGGTLARIVRTPMDMPTVRRGHAAYKRTPPLL